MANNDVILEISFKNCPYPGAGSLSGRDGHLGLISDTGIVLRIAEMHSFLEKYLPDYSLCCPENFPAELHDVEIPLSNTTDSSEVLILFLMFQKYYTGISLIFLVIPMVIFLGALQKNETICTGSVQNQNPVKAVNYVVNKCKYPGVIRSCKNNLHPIASVFRP